MWNYPLYDCIGHEVAVLTRDSSNSYSLSSEKSYDAFDNVLQGTPSKSSYSANLGHVYDEDTGLIYMQARYYDSSIGRFMNEDPLKDGINRHLYCHNNPISKADIGGTSDSFSGNALAAILFHALFSIPFSQNVFLAQAMNDFNGFDVPEKWQTELAFRIDPGGAYTAGNFFSLGSYIMDGLKLESIGKGALRLRASVLSKWSGILAMAEAYTLMLIIALVSCDMAFEDGM